MKNLKFCSWAVILSTVFLSVNKFKEQEYISGIFGGTRRKISWSDNSNSLNWFEAKGRVDKILKQFNCFTYWNSYCDKFYEK